MHRLSSLRFSSGLALILGLCALAVSPWDRQVAQVLHEHRESPWLMMARRYTDWAEGDLYIGGSLVLAILFLWVFPRWTKESRANKMREWGSYFLFCFFTFVVTGVLLLVLKISIGRYRPKIRWDWQSDLFHHFSLDHWHHSFPSGHTQVVFTFAILVAMALPRYAVLAFVYALVMASTRVLAHWHFPSDIFGGIATAILGASIALKCSRYIFPSRRVSSGAGPSLFQKE